MFVWLARTFWDFRSLALKRQRPQLVTISYSHFVEGARWCLDAAGVPYDEYGCAPGQHILPVISVRVPKGGGKPHFASSSNVGGGAKPSPTSVPCMVTPTGKVFVDSWEIAASCSSLRQIEDGEEGESIKKLLDEELGPAVRALAYCFLFKPQTLPLFNKMCTEDRHIFFRAIWCYGFGIFLIKKMVGIFKTDQASTQPECEARTQLALDKLAAILTAKKTKYFAGDEPGVADFFAAALIAVVVNPPSYGGRNPTMKRYVEEQELLDPEYKAHIEKWRAHPAGQYCLELYRTHRL